MLDIPDTSSLYTPMDAAPIIEDPHVEPRYIQGFHVTVNGKLPFGLAVVEGGEVKGKFFRVSNLHGRNVLYSIEGIDSDDCVLFELDGQMYSAIVIKGICFSNISASIEAIGGEIQYQGLEGGEQLDRVVLASKVLLDGGVETDRYVETRILRSFYVKKGGHYEEVNERGLHAYLLKGYRRTRRRFEGKIQAMPDDEKAFVLEIIADRSRELQRDLEKKTFFSTYRLQQVAERLADLSEVKSVRDYRRIFKRVFSFVNKRDEKQNGDRISKKWDYRSDEDIFNYLCEALPVYIARNIEKMHAMGICHRLLTTHNISLVGSLPDVEGAGGAVLGDEPITEEDIKGDLLTAVEALRFSLQHFIPMLQEVNLQPNYVERAIYTFMINYAQNQKNVNLSSDIVEAFPFISELHKVLNYEYRGEERFVDRVIMTQILEQFGMQLFEISMDEDVITRFAEYAKSCERVVNRMANGITITNLMNCLYAFLYQYIATHVIPAYYVAVRSAQGGRRIENFICAYLTDICISKIDENLSAHLEEIFDTNSIKS